MDATDLAATATRALTDATAGGAANTAAADLIRDRLGRSDRGRAALDEMVDARDDAVARRSVQAALTAEINADAEFAERLTLLLHGSSQQRAGRVTGRTASHRRTAAGRSTVGGTSVGRPALGAGIALAVLLVALAAFGALQLFDTTDDSPRGHTPPVPGTSHSTGRTTALPPTAETVRRLLPDRGSMDAGEYPWIGTPEVRTSAAGLSLCEAAPECEKKATAAGVVEFGRGENEGQNRAEFLVLAFPDTATAHRAYLDIVEDIEEVRVPTFRKMELERRGEESQGFDMDGTDTRINPSESALNRSMLFRQGPFIGLAHQLDDPTPQRSSRILSLASLLADRLAKAGAGVTP
ncbi:hypothetical protein [Streptomyces sp. NPDC058486]|uniref:hypothetical protein n=1 Tax=unclassified Streptomyces TaxID=2593676 RepID=UPI00364864CB